MVNVFYSIIISDHRLLDEVLEQGVHLIGLGLEEIIVGRLELQWGNEALLQLLQVQGLGLGLHLSLSLRLLVSGSSTVTVLNGPSDLALHIPALLVQFCSCFV